MSRDTPTNRAVGATPANRNDRNQTERANRIIVAKVARADAARIVQSEVVKNTATTAEGEKSS